ncbi:MAG: hypothetical protein ACREOZ_01185 [Gloeomargaritales cyanobacterium]
MRRLVDGKGGRPQQGQAPAPSRSVSFGIGALGASVGQPLMELTSIGRAQEDHYRKKRQSTLVMRRL